VFLIRLNLRSGLSYVEAAVGMVTSQPWLRPVDSIRLYRTTIVKAYVVIQETISVTYRTEKERFESTRDHDRTYQIVQKGKNVAQYGKFSAGPTSPQSYAVLGDLRRLEERLVTNDDI